MRQTHKSTRPVIAIDVDDVLALNVPAFIEFSNQRWGTRLTIDDYEEDWAHMWGMDYGVEAHRNEVDVRANELLASIISIMVHVEGAFEVLNRLKEHYDLIVVTSRRLNTKGDTLAWIQEKFAGIFKEDKIFFAGFYDDIKANSAHLNKGDIVRSLNVNYLIDDQAKHCNGAAEHGIQALLFGDYPWHKRSYIHPDVINLKDWHAVGEYFDAELKRISK